MLNFKNTRAGFINLAVGLVIGILVLGSLGYLGQSFYKEKKGLDFGDAPDGGVAYQNGEIEIAGKFPSRKVSDGLRAKDTSQVWLGNKVNRELDSSQVNNDKFDDGVAIKQEKGGTSSTVYFAVNLAKPGTLTGKAYLNFWVDLNKDGAWSTDEWVVKNQTVDLSARKESLDSYSAEFTSSNQVSDLWYRAAISYEQQVTGTTGEIKIGEVEDYGLPISGKEKSFFAKCDPEPLMLNHGQGGYIDIKEDPNSEPVTSYWVKKGSGMKDKSKEIKDSGVRSIYYKSTQVDGPKRLVVDEVKVQYQFKGWSKKFTNTCDVWIQHDEKGSGPPPGGDDDGDGDGDKDKDKEKDKEKVTYTKDITKTTDQEPTFEGKYETGTEGDYFYINLMVTPTNLAGKEFSGLEIDLGAQNPALPVTINCSVNVNLVGWGASDWKSTKSGTVHRWNGSTLMQQNSKSIMTLYFSNSLTPPTTISMKVLDKDGNASNVTLTQQ